MTATEERLPRCCPSHSDWTTLHQHLCRDFPTVDPATVERYSDELRRDALIFGLSLDDELAMGELVLRNELALMTGQREEVARLMPEDHTGRRGPSSGAVATAVGGQVTATPAAAVSGEV